MGSRPTEQATGELKKLEKQILDLVKTQGKQVNRQKKVNDEVRKGITGVTHLRNVYKGLSGQADKTANSLTKMQRSLSIVRSRLLVASFGVALFNRSLIGLLRSAGEQQKAEIQLAQALGFVSDKLVDRAAQLQKITTFGDEEIISAMALIGAYTNEEEQIDKLTTATLNLSAAKGIDLRTSADLVSKTFGSSTNALSRYGIQVEGSIGSIERLSQTIDGINKKYEGQAEVLSKTVLGSLDQANNAFGDLAERIGSDLAPVLVPLIHQLKALAEALDTRRIVSYTASIAALSSGYLIFGKALKGATTWAIAFGTAIRTVFIKSLIGVAIVATGEFIHWLMKKAGWLDQNTLSVYALGKSYDSLGQSQLDLLKVQQQSEKKLVEQLNLLNATSEEQKMLIKLGHTASDNEKELIRLIIKKTKALKEEADAKKALKSLNTDTQSLLDKEFLLKRKNAGASDTDIKLMELSMKANQDLNEHMLGNIQLRKLQDGSMAAHIETQGTLTDAQKQYAEALLSVIGLEANQIVAMEDTNAKMREKLIIIGEWAGAVGSVAGTYVDFQMQQLELEKQEDLRNAKSIKNEKTRRAEIEKINKDFDKKKRDRQKKLGGLMMLEAVANAAAAQVAIWAEKGNFWVKLAQSVAVGAANAASIATINKQISAFAEGGDFVTSGPQMIMVGDNPGGRERVQVTPLSSENISGPQEGSNITVNVSGNVMSQDFVEGELAEQIKDAIRRGTDFGIN